MPALQNDPDIREAEFSLEEKLTIQQVRFVGVRLRDLLIRYETASRADLRQHADTLGISQLGANLEAVQRMYNLMDGRIE